MAAIAFGTLVIDHWPKASEVSLTLVEVSRAERPVVFTFFVVNEGGAPGFLPNRGNIRITHPQPDTVTYYVAREVWSGDSGVRQALEVLPHSRMLVSYEESDHHVFARLGRNDSTLTVRLSIPHIDSAGKLHSENFELTFPDAAMFSNSTVSEGDGQVRTIPWCAIVGMIMTTGAGLALASGLLLNRRARHLLRAGTGYPMLLTSRWHWIAIA